MKTIMLLALVLSLSACSFSDSKKEEVVAQNDDLEFAVDTLANESANTDIKVEEQKITETKIPDEFLAPPIEEVAMTEPSEPKFEEFKKPEVMDEGKPVENHEEKVESFAASAPVETPAQIKVEAIDPVVTGGSMETYVFQKDDTLMMVAFKIYGDYRKWKDLKNWNKGKKIGEGAEIAYYPPEKRFGWIPNGLPYLVKTGDTLQIISMDKYGTTKKWKSIYDNNRPLIRDPNLIFAGFTIFYQPTRDLASEAK